MFLEIILAVGLIFLIIAIATMAIKIDKYLTKKEKIMTEKINKLL